MIRLFKFGFSVVLLLVLLVVADRFAARVAGQVVAQQIKKSQHLTTTPKVTIDGFPFLTQLVAGKYDQVDATALDIHNGDVRATSTTLHLYGVHLDAADVLSQSVKAIPVDRGAGTVVLSWADINAIVKPSGVKVTPEKGGAVAVSGSVTVEGQTVKGTGTGTVEAVPGGIRVTVANIKAAGLTATVTSLLRTKLSFTIPTSNLPFGVKVLSLTTTSTGVIVQAAIGNFTIPVG
jgi:LmeA-like phospholipid-binding